MLLLFKTNCGKPFVAKFNKDLELGTEWDKFAKTFPVISLFLEVAGITGRAAKAKFKELLSAHREVKRGEFTSGVRDGVDDATHNALNKCMQHVDEAIEYAAETRGESEYEASKQERAEKVLVGSICRASAAKGCITRGPSETEGGTCSGSNLQCAHPGCKREERVWTCRVFVGEGAATWM